MQSAEPSTLTCGASIAVFLIGRLCRKSAPLTCRRDAY